MFHKVKSVTALPNYKLCIQFSEGITKTYDVGPLIERYPLFSSLKDNPTLFQSVMVDQGGYGVIWNDDIDISCDELYANGDKIETPFDGLIAFSDASFL